MFFAVNSANRHAIRKLLTAAGHDSAVVRNMRNGELGKALYDAVASGVIREADAIAAAGAAQEGSDTQDGAETSAAAPAAATASALPSDPAALAQTIVALLTRPQTAGVDIEQVRAMVATEVEKARVTPACVNITVGNLETRMEGRQHAKFETLCRVLSTRIDGRRQHVWMAGPSGSGKSYLQSQAAKALGLPYYSTAAIQSKYDLVGFVPPNFSGDPSACASLMTPFRRAFQLGGVFGWDDIDASDPRAFASFNEALANGRYAFPDGMVDAHADFVTCASANTWGAGATADYVGRNKIDGATLSRFVRMAVDYDEQLERDMVGSEGRSWAEYVQSVRKAVVAEGIKVLITPRHTLQGAALLKAGIPQSDVERMTVYAGIDQTTEAKLRAAAGR